VRQRSAYRRFWSGLSWAEYYESTASLVAGALCDRKPDLWLQRNIGPVAISNQKDWTKVLWYARN
jgi:hypothetical protein